MKNSQYITVFAIGLIIRFYLHFYGMYSTFSERFEVVSSYNSMESVFKMVYNYKNSQPEYKTMCHPSPFLITILYPLLSRISYETAISLLGVLFIAIDSICALLILFIIPPTYKDSLSPDFLSLMYFLHPYTIMNCIGLSTSLINYTVLFLSIVLCIKKSILSVIVLPILIMLYPPFIPVLVPLLLLLNNKLYQIISILLIIITPIIFNLSYYVVDSVLFNCITKDYTMSLSLFWQLFLQVYEEYDYYYQYLMVGMYFALPMIFSILFYEHPYSMLIIVLILIIPLSPFVNVYHYSILLILFYTHQNMVNCIIYCFYCLDYNLFAYLLSQMTLFMATGRLTQFAGGFDGNLNHIFINLMLSYLCLVWNILMFAKKMYNTYYPESCEKEEEKKKIE